VTLPEAVVTRILERWPVARLALHDAAGEPRQLSIVFARAEGALWSTVDGRREAERRARAPRPSLERRPAVSLLRDDYAADWSPLW
jgi:hypothetical protein